MDAHGAVIHRFKTPNRSMFVATRPDGYDREVTGARRPCRGARYTTTRLRLAGPREEPILRPFFRRPVDDILTGLGHIMMGKRPRADMALMVIAMIVTWFVYVPIHELLHAFACLATGGDVSRLDISAHYGGTLLAEWIPWVSSGSDYAGQLTGFNTFGNDWIYLATDFGPYLLTLLIGIPLVRFCTKGRRPILFGAGFVMAAAPFYGLPGDYFEMGSIISTRGLTLATEGFGYAPRFSGLRSDDIFTLVPDIITQPAELGLGAGVGTIAFGLLVTLISLLIAVWLAFATYRLGDLIARVLVGPAPVFRMPPPPKRLARSAAAQ